MPEELEKKLDQQTEAVRYVSKGVNFKLASPRSINPGHRHTNMLAVGGNSWNNAQDERTIVEATIPANTFGTAGGVHGWARITDMRGTTGTDTFVYRVWLDNAFVVSVSVTNVPTSSVPGTIEFYVTGTNSAQKASLMLRLHETGTKIADTSVDYIFYDGYAGNWTRDMTKPVVCKLTGQWTGSLNQIFAAPQAFIELL